MEAGYGCPEGGQFSDLSVQVGEFLGQQLPNVLARHSAGVSQLQNLTDLSQGKSGGSTAADELQPSDHLFRVVPVTVWRSLRSRQ